MDREWIYSKLPLPLQELAVSFEGRRIRKTRFNADFKLFLAAYEARALWPRERTLAYRDQRLSAFIAHAAETVPYYRKLFQDLGAVAEDFKTLEDLSKLPVLTKQTVQEQSETFLSEAVPASACMTCHTSGTTGAGLRFPASHDSQREHWAVWWRYRRWHGLTLDTPCLYFGGRSIVPLTQQRPPFWRHNRPGKQCLFSGYHLSPATASAYLDAMRRAKAPWIHGYPSLVSLIAKFALEEGVDLDLRWVTLGAEGVLPRQAAIIKEAFGLTPLSHYSMAEGVANISRCPEGRYHIDEDFAAVDLQPLDGAVHRILGVNLSNPAFPLLRYDTGDLAVIDESECACGRPGRTISQIDGRKEDYVITKSGAFLGRLDHIFKDMVRIREAQIRQSRKGHMRLCIVKGPAYTATDEQLLREETTKRVGTDMDFDIEYHEQLPRTKSGKLRFVLSEIPGSDRPSLLD